MAIGSGSVTVSTHSRLKAAGNDLRGWTVPANVSTHSRLKAAGKKFGRNSTPKTVSTHSRLKAAGVISIISIP